MFRVEYGYVYGTIAISECYIRTHVHLLVDSKGQLVNIRYNDIEMWVGIYVSRYV